MQITCSKFGVYKRTGYGVGTADSLWSVLILNLPGTKENATLYIEDETRS